MMPTQGPQAAQAPMQGAAPSGPGSTTITIDMQPGGAITLNSAQGSKQCESIGECLQAILEMYEQIGGKEGEGAFEAGYSDQAPQESRAIGGVPVK